MRIESSDLECRDGRPYRIRTARPDDAGRVLDHIHLVHARDPEVNEAGLDEMLLDANSLRSLLNRFIESPNSLYLLSESDVGEVLGTVYVVGGGYRRTHHAAEVGVSVHPGWRRQGVGWALLMAAIHGSRAAGGLRRLWLKVFSTNTAALALFESVGFVVEGRARGQVLLGGEYVDELLMALDLTL